MRLRRSTSLTLQERMDAKTLRSDGCWTWIGANDGRRGYGSIKVNGRNMKAHRVAWELANGTTPGDLSVCHECDNPKCVRPDHLFLGTSQDNARDMIAKGRGRSPGIFGSEHYASKLSDDDVDAIRRMYAEGITCRSIGEKFAIGESYACSIALGKRWVRKGSPVQRRKPRRHWTITPDIAVQMRAMSRAGSNGKDIARAFKCAEQSVSCVLLWQTFVGHADVNVTKVARKPNPASDTRSGWNVAAEIRKLCAHGMSQSEVARRFAVSASTVSLIVLGKIWRAPKEHTDQGGIADSDDDDHKVDPLVAGALDLPSDTDVSGLIADDEPHLSGFRDQRNHELELAHAG